MNAKIRKLSYLGVRGKFHYSTKLVLKFLPPKTSLYICTVMACVFRVGLVDTLYRDKPGYDLSLEICTANALMKICIDACFNKLFQWNGKWPQWC